MKMKIFVDMNGVIADFSTPALRANGAVIGGEDEYPEECGWDILKACNKIRAADGVDRAPLTEDEFWNNLGYDFWYGLPMYPVAQTFIKYLEFWGDVYIATAPALQDECVSGKYAWIKKHFPEYRSKLFICTHKELLADKNSILIDDRDRNCEAFEKAGGLAVPVPRPWNNFEVDDENPHPYDKVCKEVRGICQ
jgi:5'(3')-deoxyribonucleotidase